MLDRRSIRVVLVAGAFAAVMAESARARTLDLPVRVVGRDAAAGPAYLGDRLSIRLRPEAVRRATPSPFGMERRSSLGIASLDVAAQALGGAWFEPEFKGESTPPAGSGQIDFSAFYLVHLPVGSDLASALDLWSSLPEVESADPIAVAPITAAPNDSLWPISDWFYQPPSRRDLHAPEAWDVTTGDTSIIVAIIDTGVLPYHPELGGQIAGLSGSLWTNWAERGGIARVDDDQNGFVDDLWGWDFVDLAPGSDVRAGEDGHDTEGDPNDYIGHGTAVAGIVGAIANNGMGIAGTVWQARLMTLRAGWSSNRSPGGEISMSFAAQAIRYATRMGAKVINCSFSNLPSEELDAAITDATRAGALVVFAAGNNGSPNAVGDRTDVLTVSAVDRDDRVTAFSNLASWVDVAAPGASIATTMVKRTGTDSLGLRQPGYVATAGGTSFATPFAVGAAALVQGRRVGLGLPLLDPMALLLHLRETADDISSLNPSVRGFGTGRLNLERAVATVPASRVIRTGGRMLGAAVVWPRDAGPDRIALVTSSSTLLILDDQTGETVRVVPLRAKPASGLSAANLGAPYGDAMFVALDNGTVAGFWSGGDPLPGWPVGPVLGGAFTLGTAIADLDGDGIADVVAARPSGIRAWRADGTLLMSWSHADPLTAPVAIAELDGWRGAEVIAVRRSGVVHALRADGTELPGWPVPLGAGPLGTAGPVVAQFGDARGTTVIVADRLHLTALRADGSLRFQVPLWNWAALEPALADLDGDGSDEVIVAMGPYLAAFDSTGTRVWAPTDAYLPWAQVPPAVGYLGETREPAVMVWIGLELMAYGADGRALPGFPKPGGLAGPVTLSGRDRGHATEVLAGADSLFIMYDLGPDSWSPEPHPWPTLRGSFARTGNRVRSIGSADVIPPLAVTDLAATVGPAGIEFTWSAPADIGPLQQATSYEMRWATTPIDSTNFWNGALVAGVPRPSGAGQPERTLVTGFPEVGEYFFALRSRDAGGNVSDLSNPIAAVVPGFRPAPVRNLVGSWRRDVGITLDWTATGDDSLTGAPERYRIRAAGAPLDDASFADAPIERVAPARTVAGGTERIVISDLPLRGFLWFALKAEDDRNHSSALSNVVKLTAPVRHPAGVIDLEIESATDSSAWLRWTATGDDGPYGRPLLYQIRAAAAPLDELSFENAPYGREVAPTIDFGSDERLLLTGLPRARRLHFRIRALGSTGLGSPLSNQVSDRTGVGGPLRGRMGTALAALLQPSRPPVLLYWQSDEAAEQVTHTLALFDVNGRRVRTLAVGPAVGGVVEWDGRDEHGAQVGAGLYFARLTDGTHRAGARIMLLR